MDGTPIKKQDRINPAVSVRHLKVDMIRNARVLSLQRAGRSDHFPRLYAKTNKIGNPDIEHGHFEAKVFTLSTDEHTVVAR